MQGTPLRQLRRRRWEGRGKWDGGRNAGYTTGRAKGALACSYARRRMGEASSMCMICPITRSTFAVRGGLGGRRRRGPRGRFLAVGAKDGYGPHAQGTKERAARAIRLARPRRGPPY
jgi:hypothetical protein